MKDRAQLLVALLVLAAVLGAALEVDRIGGARPLGAAAPPGVPSGAWFCPHGGGDAWDVRIGLANPGAEPVLARLRGIGAGRPTPPEERVVPPGSTVIVPVPGEGREASTVVEYFGGVLAAGWLEVAGEDANGVASEPCLPDAGERWLLPDGSGLREYDDVVVVMNPLPAPAVVSLTVFSEGRDPVQTERWTNVTIPAYHARAFRLDTVALGETTASALVEAGIGRVAVATLGVSTTGGIRSAVGVPAGVTEQILPGAGDVGRSELAVVSTSEERTRISGELLEPEGRQPLSTLAEAGPRPRAATTVPLTTETPSALLVRADRQGVAFVRRTFGVVADQGSTAGATEPGTAWVLTPSVIGQPSHPRIVLANPGDAPATVLLSALPVEGAAAPAPVTVRIPPGAAVLAPKAFTAQAATSSVLAVARAGTFVPLSASYALGREGYATYAVALGARLPSGWGSAPVGV